MSGPRIGALFAGYGGLDLAVQSVYGGHMAWYSEIDKGALKILGHRFPDVPNVGSVTEADWSQVEPVDILTGGSPCQDLSHAGRRAGMTAGTRSNLWVAMREAIAQLRPSVVVWENVRGAYSAGADSALEFCAGCMGDAWDRGPVLRALGRVLGDLSDLGYDARWHGLRAADVGAPHGRFRVFVVATDAEHDGPPARAIRRGAGSSEGIRRLLEPQGSPTDPRLMPAPTVDDAERNDPNLSAIPLLLPTPKASNFDGSTSDGFTPNLRERVSALLPTPAVNKMGEGKTVERWDEWTADMQAKHGNGNGHGKSLAIEAQRLLGTPTVAMSRRSEEFASVGESPAEFAATYDGTWGDYAAAIARWEHALGRPAPEPTQTSTKGNPQLSPAFVEWMMGLPAGWVTDVPGITRNEALKALGNGVVPQQAAAALVEMASWQAAAA